MSNILLLKEYTYVVFVSSIIPLLCILGSSICGIINISQPYNVRVDVAIRCLMFVGSGSYLLSCLFSVLRSILSRAIVAKSMATLDYKNIEYRYSNSIIGPNIIEIY
jgi:hypothetical protein